MDLRTFFQENPKLALGFSGGVDSSYLLWAAIEYGAQVRAYYIKTAFQPGFEYEDAMRMAQELGAEITVIEADALSFPKVAENSEDRCYHCKKALFGLLTQRAIEDGFTLIIDGTNASDDVDDRPGMRALKELSVRSPLRECGMTKDEIRICSQDAGLFTWDKPAYACLATRIPTGRKISVQLLKKVERAEGLLSMMGFKDFRVRMYGSAARLQFSQEQMSRALQLRAQICMELSPYFKEVFLDLGVSR